MTSTAAKPAPLVVVERAHIVKALRYTHGDMREAAKLLDIGLSTLYRRIEEYNIRFVRSVAAGGGH